MPKLAAINTQYFEVILSLTRLCGGNKLKFGYYPRTGGEANAVLAQELAGEAALLSLITTVERQKSGKGSNAQRKFGYKEKFLQEHKPHRQSVQEERACTKL